ncbi:translation regulator [Malassezia pachydermatis]
MTTTPAAPAAPLASATAPKPAEMGASFIPGQLAAPPVDSAEARTAAAARGEHVAPQDLPDEGKMFVGGLNWDTDEESLRRYFGQFGPVTACTVMRDSASGRSRGFAFVTFSDPKSVNAVMVREHFLDGKIIDPKRAIPRPEQSKTQKCFVGGLPQTVTQDSFKQLFQQFGHVLDSTVMMDKDTGRPRGFGFVTFENDEGVENTLAHQPLMLDGKQIEVKRAQSRGQPQPNAAPNRFVSDPAHGSNAQAPLRMWGSMPDAGKGGAPGGAPGGFDPQAMAKMYQQMGWGSSAWNPQMMWQQMMAAYMGGAAAKGGWAPGGQASPQNGNGYGRSGPSAGGDAGWNGRGGSGSDDSRPGRSGGGSYQRERSPSRGSRNYDERGSRF